jgi:ComF family protein
MRQPVRMPRIDQCVKNVLDWLYSPRCAVCADPVGGPLALCPDCIDDLPRPPPQCPRCGGGCPGIGLCGQCQHNPPAFDVSIAPLAYRPPVDHLIHEFKYRRRIQHARLLGELFLREVRPRITTPPDVIIPVPLHRSRLRHRGFNQSVELARPIARALSIHIDRRIAIRTRDTRPQTGLPIKQRRQNIHGAFAIRGPVPYRHVAIVDDVMTSGHTVSQLARCLKYAGVKQIQVWALARTQLS